MPTVTITDQVTIRGLMEVESWLAMADQRRAHSLKYTSKFFMNNHLLTETETEAGSISKADIPLRLPASIYSKEKSVFVGLGWAKLAKSLAATMEKSEMELLKVMPEKLNSKFALQLDTEPVFDRLVHTSEVRTSHTIVFAGRSYASRIAEAARSAYPEVVDLYIGGWRLSKESAVELAQDLTGVLEDADKGTHTVVLHLFDNSIFKGEVDGELTDPFKIGKKFHISGKLQLINHADFKQLFETALPIIRSCSGSKVILLGPLPRFLLNKCCTDPTHITNFDEKEYLSKLGNDIRDLGKHLRNMAHMRRLKRTKVLNPAALMGVLDSGVEPDKLLALFGTDSVHLTETGYKAISSALGDELDTPHVVHVRSLMAATPAPSRNTRGQRPPPRESWTVGTEVVAHRNASWSESGGPGWGRRGGSNVP